MMTTGSFPKAMIEPVEHSAISEYRFPRRKSFEGDLPRFRPYHVCPELD